MREQLCEGYIQIVVRLIYSKGLRFKGCKHLHKWLVNNIDPDITLAESAEIMKIGWKHIRTQRSIHALTYYAY